MGAIGWRWLSLILVILPLVEGSRCYTLGEYVHGELVVSFKLGVSPKQVDLVAQEVEAEVRHQIEGTNLYLFVFQNETKAQVAIDILREREIVEAVFHNIIFRVPEPEPVPLPSEKPETKPGMPETPTSPIKDKNPSKKDVQFPKAGRTEPVIK